MKKAPFYMPISVIDAIELTENGKTDQIFYEWSGSLCSIKGIEFSFEELTTINFYVKQEYTSKNEQE